MKSISFSVFLAGVLGVGVLLFQGTNASIGDEPPHVKEPGNMPTVDPALLKKVRPVYPDIQLERGQLGDAYFSDVREVARIQGDEGKTRLLVRMGVTIPSQSDRGWSHYLLFADIQDARPIVAVSGHTVGDDIQVVESRWVRFGDGPLLSLREAESLQDFNRLGEQLLSGLSHHKARTALEAYMNEGLDAFLDVAPVGPGRDHHVRNMPERVRQIEVYPAMIQDFRGSHFRYSSPWEGTVFARITPADPARKTMIIEIGAKGSSEGITSEEVDLVLHGIHNEEPVDRPDPQVLVGQ